MRYSSFVQLAISGCAMAAPFPQTPSGGAAPATGATPPPAGADPTSLDLGAILGGLMGGAGGADLSGLLGSLGGLFGGGAPDTSTPVIIAGYNSVKTAGDAFNTAIGAIPASGDAAAAVKSVIEKSQAVESALKDAATKISAVPNVDLLASGGLSAPGDQVTQIVVQSTDALVAKKDVIVKANQKDAVLQAAKSLKAAVETFTNAINGKLPDMSRQAGEAESKKSLDAVDKVIAAFT